jgi:hypothetical protein
LKRASVTVKNFGSVQDFRGNLALQTRFGKGRVDLTIDDTLDNGSRVMTLTGTSVLDLFPGAISFGKNYIGDLTIWGSSGVNTMDITDTPYNHFFAPTVLNGGPLDDTIKVQGTTGALQVNGEGGFDAISVGLAGRLDNIQGDVTLAGPVGSILLTIDDSQDLVGRTAFMDAGSFRFAPFSQYAAAIQWTPTHSAKGGVVLANVLGGKGGNTYTVVDSGDLDLYTALSTGSGDDNVTVTHASGKLFIFGGGGSDHVNIGAGHFTHSIGAVVVDNSGGHTALTLDDSADSAGQEFRAVNTNLGTDIEDGFDVVNYYPGDVQSVTIKAGSGDDSLSLLGLGANTTYDFQGGPGTNALYGAVAGSVWNITGADTGLIDGQVNFSNVQHLIGWGAADIFRFAPGGSISGTIDGGGGGDWLDYSAVKTGVSVDLSKGKASQVASGQAGGISNIRNVRGSDIGNALAGDNQGNILVGGAGSDVIIGGNGRNVLIGGKGADDIRAGSAGDLLIAGRTSFDDDVKALAAIQAEWLSADSYQTRIGKLRAGVGPDQAYRLAAGTVFADSVKNMLTGGAGQDWFFAGNLDFIAKKQAGERMN